MIERVLLCTDGSLYSQISYHYAAWLAFHINISIEILYVTDVRKEKAIASKNFSGSIGIDAYQQLLNKLVESERQTAKINHQRAKIVLSEAKRFFEDRDIDRVKTTHHTGFLIDSLHEFEAQADLIILGKRGETAGYATEHLGSNMERIVRASHKPCLVTPREYQSVEKVLIAYDGGKSCKKALQYLEDLPIFKPLEIHLVIVGNHDVKTAKKYLEFAESKLIAAEYQPICNLIHGDVSTELIDYIRQNQINFLIMGAYGHSILRHLVIGSTTAHMLHSSTIPVMLFR